MQLRLKVAGFIFLMVSLLHASRLIFKFDLVAGHTFIPFWVNGLAALVALWLAQWMLRAPK